MIETLLLLGWGFVLAAAWGLAGYRNAEAAKKNELAMTLLASNARIARENARQMTEEVLRRWKDAQRERYRTLDDLLGALPKEWGSGPPYFRMMESGDFRAVAHHLSDAPICDVTFTALDFEAVQFRLNGRRFSGWKRNGWVLMPDELC